MVRSFPLAGPGAMAGRAAGIYTYRPPGLLSMPGRIFTRVEMLCQLRPICRPPIAVNTLRNGYQC